MWHCYHDRHCGLNVGAGGGPRLPQLKARCFDFLADGDNFKMVATSGEYLQLMQSFPTLLVEVRNRIKIAHEESTIINSGAHKKSRVC